MPGKVSKDLAAQMLTYESYLQVEQRLAIMLNKFSTYIERKNRQQLVDIRLQIQKQSQRHYLDNDTVKLCLQMLHIVDRQLRRLKGH